MSDNDKDRERMNDLLYGRVRTRRTKAEYRRRFFRLPDPDTQDNDDENGDAA